MNDATTQTGQQTLKTYKVLDAINAGANRIPLIVDSTELTTRTVNALIYALEKQGRLLANSYEVQRSDQVFAILRYEADTTKGKPRIHPNPRACGRAELAARTNSAARANFAALHRAFMPISMTVRAS